MTAKCLHQYVRLLETRDTSFAEVRSGGQSCMTRQRWRLSFPLVSLADIRSAAAVLRLLLSINPTPIEEALCARLAAVIYLYLLSGGIIYERSFMYILIIYFLV
jgi:hypothetical protein